MKKKNWTDHEAVELIAQPVEKPKEKKKKNTKKKMTLGLFYFHNVTETYF